MKTWNSSLIWKLYTQVRATNVNKNLKLLFYLTLYTQVRATNVNEYLTFLSYNRKPKSELQKSMDT